MKKKTLILFSLISLFSLASCGGKGPSIDPDDPPTPPVVKYETLDKVIKNTSRYTLKTDDETDDGFIYQIVDNNLFYYACNMGGYILDSQDESYFHLFDVSYNDIDDVNELKMSVGGRSFHKNLYEEKINNLLFTSILWDYQDYFFPEEDNFYTCETYDVVRSFGNFFQLKGMLYCNYIELTISTKNTLDTIKFYEKNDDNKILTYAYKIYPSNINEVGFYTDWVKNGKIIKERIFDIKQKDLTNNNLSVYENANLSLSDCVVVGKSISEPNLYYVAQNDELTGPVGLKVYSDNLVDLSKLDIVDIRGTVKTENNCVVLRNSSLNKKGTVEYAPRFSEEVIGNNYGGGVYAYEIFSSSSMYDGSLYTTFAKLTEIPSQFSSIEDSSVQLAFPDIYSTNDVFYINLVIPKELPSEQKEAILSNISGLTTFEIGGIPGDDLSIENVIVDYQTENDETNVVLVCTEDTIIHKKYEPREQIEVIYPTLKDIPLPSGATGEITYKCGEDSGINIEDNYLIEVEYGTKGVFYGCDLSEENYQQYLQDLINYGCIKYDEIRDFSSKRHVIFTKGRYIIDVSYVNDWSGSIFYMWIYRSDNVLRMASIEEKIEEQVGSFFDIKNFLKLTGTFDADYLIHSLYSYAGTDYSDNPITCVTLDLNENKYFDYVSSLVQDLGYSQYRVDGRVAYYTIRGASHQGFIKDGAFLDVAVYNTSDYTYYGHDSWNYRVEILILEGDKPLTIRTYDSLDCLSDLYESVEEGIGYKINLPEGSKVELWKRMPYGYWNVNYGYNGRNEAFVYSSDLNAAIQSIKDGLINSGYELQNTYSRGWLYYKKTSSGQYPVLVLNESSKGYLRIMNDIGGLSFLV